MLTTLAQRRNAALEAATSAAARHVRAEALFFRLAVRAGLRPTPHAQARLGLAGRVACMRFLRTIGWLDELIDLGLMARAKAIGSGVNDSIAQRYAAWSFRLRVGPEVACRFRPAYVGMVIAEHEGRAIP